MIDPTVRRATPADVGDLELLEAEARAALVDQRGGARWLEEHPSRAGTWARALDDDVVLVADLDGVVVGYLVLAGTAPVAVVDQVWVTPDAREVGFGDALLETATAIARERGDRVLEGEALPGDRQTKNLYERAGITARLITVSTRLDR